ncbi:ORF6N domain-containing protein [Candidatus Woesearchaeota archaeon]|nr:ORF6N domain-containing protein [Candidatus Woesearchaeota archaeon]
MDEKEYDSLKSQSGYVGESSLRFQFGTSNPERGGRRYLPYVFTEQGVSMLSGVLRSETAVRVSIQIINAFVAMRKFISKNAELFSRLDSVERKQLSFEIKTDNNFERVFTAIEDKSFQKKQGIFFDGQVFDAYNFVSNLIRSAKKSIVLIDNYVDDSVLMLFSKRDNAVKAVIYTKNLSRQLKLDLEKYNFQYPFIAIQEFNNSHDRFLIIDEKDVYHIGASLKDLGKKWFAFSKFDKEAARMLEKLK